MALVETSRAQVILKETECSFESFRGSGAGGQHRNVTDSAVRITHLPTGMVVKSESQRSWWQNRNAAMAELANRLASAEATAAAVAANQDRTSQIGVGDRPSHDWTWCGWRDEVTHHRSGRRYQMSAALKGRFL